MKTYKINTQTVQTATTIEAENCNAITFINVGTATAYIKGLPLTTGQSLEISGNECEQDTTNYEVRFSSDNAQLFVLRKTYQ